MIGAATSRGIVPCTDAGIEADVAGQLAATVLGRNAVLNSSLLTQHGILSKLGAICKAMSKLASDIAINWQGLVRVSCWKSLQQHIWTLH